MSLTYYASKLLLNHSGALATGTSCCCTGTGTGGCNCAPCVTPVSSVTATVHKSCSDISPTFSLTYFYDSYEDNPPFGCHVTWKTIFGGGLTTNYIFATCSTTVDLFPANCPGPIICGASQTYLDPGASILCSPIGLEIPLNSCNPTGYVDLS